MENVCCICLSGNARHRPCVCAAAFHPACLEPWVRCAGTCPNCRGPIPHQPSHHLKIDVLVLMPHEAAAYKLLAAAFGLIDRKGIAPREVVDDAARAVLPESMLRVFLRRRAARPIESLVTVKDCDVHQTALRMLCSTIASTPESQAVVDGAALALAYVHNNNG